MFRLLRRDEVPDLWTIDRSEYIERIYRHTDGALVPEDHFFDVPGWPLHELERDKALLFDCFDNGGTFFGAFSEVKLVGASVLESRFIGSARDQLQLKFLHVSRDQRGTGLGNALFDQAAAKALNDGARTLYISAAPSENAVRFYQSRGCRLSGNVDPDLFELEPEDIHLELDLS